MINPIVSDNIKQLRQLQQALEQARLLDSDMTITYLSGLLLIAVRQEIGNPVEVLELGELLGTTGATASRLTNYLSKMGQRGKPGLGFVVKEIDIMDQRKKVIKLTPKGYKYLENMLAAMNK